MAQHAPTDHGHTVESYSLFFNGSMMGISILMSCDTSVHNNMSIANSRCSSNKQSMNGNLANTGGKHTFG